MCASWYRNLCCRMEDKTRRIVCRNCVVYAGSVNFTLQTPHSNVQHTLRINTFTFTETLFLKLYILFYWNVFRMGFDILRFGWQCVGVHGCFSLCTVYCCNVIWSFVLFYYCNLAGNGSFECVTVTVSTMNWGQWVAICYIPIARLAAITWFIAFKHRIHSLSVCVCLCAHVFVNMTKKVIIWRLICVQHLHCKKKIFLRTYEGLQSVYCWFFGWLIYLHTLTLTLSQIYLPRCDRPTVFSFIDILHFNLFSHFCLSVALCTIENDDMRNSILGGVQCIQNDTYWNYRFFFAVVLTNEPGLNWNCRMQCVCLHDQINLFFFFLL